MTLPAGKGILISLAVAGLLWLFPGLALSAQLAFWALASIAMTATWFRFFRPAMVDRTKADGDKQAIDRIAQAIQEKELPVVYLLGEKYIEYLKGLAESANGKTIQKPSDIPAAVRGIIGGLGK